MILSDDKSVLFINFNIPESSTLTIYNNKLSGKSSNKLYTYIDNLGYIILRNGKNILRVSRQSEIEENKAEKLIFQVKKNEDSKYILDNPYSNNFSEYNTESLNNKLWLVINNRNYFGVDNERIINEDYEILENDILKFGNVKYNVSKLSIKSEDSKLIYSTDENEDLDLSEKEDNIENDNKNEIRKLNENYKLKPNIDLNPEFKTFYISDEKNEICKLCNDSKCSSDNPIIQFCSCYSVHFECLKNQIKPYIYTIENDKVINYYINNLKCKTCNFKIPLRFNIKIDENKNKNFELIDIKKPENDYIILESLENKMYYGYMKLIHVIKLNNSPKEEIKIGRHKEKNDMIICDPSVSKEHAILKFNRKKERVKIINLSQTFGSCVLIKGPLTINKKIEIQTGKIKFGVENLTLKETMEKINEICEEKYNKKFDEINKNKEKLKEKIEFPINNK